MTLLRLCLYLALVNAVTVGGGYAMIPLLQAEIVEARHWLTAQEFLDTIAIGQITPGPLTVMNAVLGYRAGGVLGAVLAMLASYLPCVVFAALVSRFYLRYRTSRLVRATLDGLRPAVVGLLAAVALVLGRQALGDPSAVAIGSAVFALASATRIDPTYLILGGGLAAWLLR
jgi:chromate transporter